MAMAMNAVSFLAAAFVIITVARAKNHTVGDMEGWTTGVDYEEWASKNPINVGDILLFDYLPYFHDVLSVTKEHYDSCTTTSPISSDDSGLTIAKIVEEGVAYFICGIGEDCQQGMKLTIQTTGYSGSGDSPPPPASKSRSPPSDSSEPTPPTSKSKSPPSQTSQPPPAAGSWKLNSAHKFSSTGSFALTFALMIMAAF